MEDNRHYNKHLMLYLCVGLCGSLILGGWIFSVKASFDEMRENAESAAGQRAADDVMSGFEGIMQDGEEMFKLIDKLKEEEKNANLEAQVESLKKQTEEMNKKLEQLPVQPAPAPAPVEPVKPEIGDDPAI